MNKICLKEDNTRSTIDKYVYTICQVSILSFNVIALSVPDESKSINVLRTHDNYKKLFSVFTELGQYGCWWSISLCMYHWLINQYLGYDKELKKIIYHIFFFMSIYRRN